MNELTVSHGNHSQEQQQLKEILLQLETPIVRTIAMLEVFKDNLQGEN